MKTQDFEFDDKGDEVVKAVDALDSETADLAELNDEPHLRQSDVEGIFAVLVRVVAALFKH